MMKIDLANAVIIIDEAHNIAQCGEDALSFEINAKQLQAIVQELTGLIEFIRSK
jgi:Rad3-related DNA helicase